MGDAVEPHFPPEIWELIFGECAFPDLKQFRLVCHRWNTIVLGCLSFRRRNLVRLYGADLREINDPARPPLTNGNDPFRVVVVRVDSGWSEFGPYLEKLTFVRCVIPVGMFFRMLRYCPNLKRLQLGATGFLDGPVDNGFRLEAMEDFDIYCLYPKLDWSRASVIDLFGPVFPRLNTFSFKWNDHYTKADQRNLIRFMQTVQGTLQTLRLEYKNNLLKELCGMNQLHLEQAALNIDLGWPSRNTTLWKRFCQAQQTLEELSLMEGTVPNELLLFTVQNLPNLKKLCVNLIGPDLIVPTFLSHLKRVEHVEIGACRNLALDFRLQLSPTLKEFHLHQTEIRHGLETLTTSPTLQKLTLEQCDLTDDVDSTSAHNGTNLRHLVLVKCGTYPQTIDHILSCRPLLETVRLERVGSVRKQTIAKLLHQSPKLHEVVLHKCYGFDETEAEIMNHYHSSYGAVEGSRKVRFVIEELTEDDDDYY